MTTGTETVVRIEHIGRTIKWTFSDHQTLTYDRDKKTWSNIGGELKRKMQLARAYVTGLEA